MRKIEQAIIAAMKEGKALKSGSRDEVRIVNPQGAAIYCLHGTPVAVWNPVARLLVLGVDGGKWSTNTTKSRINSIARAFGAQGIHQKDFSWTWDDGTPYYGDRTFQV